MFAFGVAFGGTVVAETVLLVSFEAGHALPHCAKDGSGVVKTRGADTERGQVGDVAVEAILFAGYDIVGKASQLERVLVRRPLVVVVTVVAHIV